MGLEGPLIALEAAVLEGLAQTFGQGLQRRRGHGGAGPEDPPPAPVAETIQDQRERLHIQATGGSLGAGPGLRTRPPQEGQGDVQVGRGDQPGPALAKGFPRPAGQVLLNPRRRPEGEKQALFFALFAHCPPQSYQSSRHPPKGPE